MINKKEIVAMLLAGGQGSRLFALTQKKAKPAVSYGGKYKIIDFPLSNCANSGIDTVGVLTQYEPLELNAYIGTGGFWDLDDLMVEHMYYLLICVGKQVTGIVEQQMRFIRTSTLLIIMIQTISSYYLETRSVQWIMQKCFSIIKKKNADLYNLLF